jgi:hypothetical protein
MASAKKTPKAPKRVTKKRAVKVKTATAQPVEATVQPVEATVQPVEATIAKAPQHTNADAALVVYEDFRPVVSEGGGALGMALAIVNTFMAASCLKIAYGGDFFKLCRARMRQKLEAVPPERRLPPPPEVVGPLLAHYPYVAEKEELRDMFENLLAASTDSKGGAHPSFVEVLKQINSDEAKLLRSLGPQTTSLGRTNLPMILVLSIKAPRMAREVGRLTNLDLVGPLEAPNRLAVYEDNLARLSLLQFDSRRKLANKSLYEELEKAVQPSLERVRERASARGQRIALHRGMMIVTDFGAAFLRACLGPKNSDPPAP